MTDTPRPDAASVTATPSPEIASLYVKLSAEGPIALDAAEANALRGAFKELLLRVTELEATNRVNCALAEALKKQGFEMVREQNPDGTLGWNLQNAPQPTAETVN